ncbi:MAG: MBL fold metallo-hydrolase [Gemmatimonadota bacterium]|nr:MBL fold metallo-hydrolase [Gemmatimonadota bacterium]
MRRDVLGLAALVIIAVTSAAAAPARQDGIAVTFLANEGVLLAGDTPAGRRQVLIDALFEPYDDYAVPADSTQSALRQAHPPFAGADLILVTHRHGDHFHPAPVARHLGENSRAVLLTSDQVIDSLRGRIAPELLTSPRIIRRTTPPGTRRRMLVNGLPVELLGLPHGGRRHRQVEHLGFVVELGGRRVLHVGDAELSEATLAPFRLDTARIDIALLPYWAASDEATRNVIARWVRPGRIAAFHISDRDTARVRKSLRSAAPEAHVFARSLETVTW